MRVICEGLRFLVHVVIFASFEILFVYLIKLFITSTTFFFFFAKTTPCRSVLRDTNQRNLGHKIALFLETIGSDVEDYPALI